MPAELPSLLPGVEPALVGDIDAATDWEAALRGVDVVVHLAARVHQMRESLRGAALLEQYRAINTYGALHLAEEAAKRHVKRLVFISTVKVHGEDTAPDAPYTEASPTQPSDPYGISKYEAEAGLRKIAAHSGMEVTIVRPCLVYGPGVRGNILRLLQLADAALPLPLKGVRNVRSLLGLANFADFLHHVLAHPRAANETFLLSDGEDLSTSTLFSLLARGMGRPERQFAFPEGIVRGMLGVCGMGGVYRRLWGSLAVDSGKARRLLAWTPPAPPATGLRETAEWYASRKASR